MYFHLFYLHLFMCYLFVCVLDICFGRRPLGLGGLQGFEHAHMLNDLYRGKSHGLGTTSV